MIITVKNADFSASGLGKMPIVTQETIDLVANLGRVLNGTQTMALQLFFNDIASIKAKIDILTLPCLASTKEKAFINVLSNFQPALSSGVLTNAFISTKGLRYSPTPGANSMNYLPDTRVHLTTANSAHTFAYIVNDGYSGTQGVGGNFTANMISESLYGGSGEFSYAVSPAQSIGIGINFMSYTRVSTTANFIAKYSSGVQITSSIAAPVANLGNFQYCNPYLYEQAPNPVSLFSSGQYLDSAEMLVLETAARNFLTVMGL